MGVWDRNYIDENMNEIMDDITSAFPYFLHITELTEKPFPWHWHEELELGYLAEGKAKIFTTEAEYVLDKGDVFLVNSNSIHMSEACSPEVKTVEISNLFNHVLLSGHFHSIFETKYMRPVLRNHNLQVIVLKGTTEPGRKIRESLQKIESLYQMRDSELLIRNQLSEAWLYLYEVIVSDPNQDRNRVHSSQERIRTMIAFICEHYAEKISLEDIAGSANISIREATRSFKKALGQSPIDYLTSYRLNNTEKLLTSTMQSVTEIAYTNGFTDSAYYAKLFKKKFGVTPSEYRVQHRQNP